MITRFDITFARYRVRNSEVAEEPYRHGIYEKNLRLRDALSALMESETRYCYLEGLEPSASPIENSRWITARFHHFYDSELEEKVLHFPENLTRAGKRRIARLLEMKGV